VESVKKPTQLHTTYFFSRREREQRIYRKRAFTNGRIKARILRTSSPHPDRPPDFRMTSRSPRTTSPAIKAIRPNITKKYWQIAAEGIDSIQAGSTEGRKFIILDR
jgi:predicted nucleic acid-binding Zn ribbon protein